MKHGIAILGVLLALSVPALAATYIVRPDGSGDFPTIQAAIDVVVDGDIIELGDGSFTGNGNRDIDYLGKAIMVRSQSGNPETCVIDCEGTVVDPHRGFFFHSDEDATSVLEGVTITNGYVDGPGGTVDDWGGAVLCYCASPTLTNCVFTNGQASDSGAGVEARYCSPTISGCTFTNNRARWAGGIQCWNAPTTITDCLFRGNFGSVNTGAVGDVGTSSLLTNVTFWENATPGKGGALVCNGACTQIVNCTFFGNISTSHQGGAMWIFHDACPILENTIIAFSEQGEAVYSDGGTPTLICCDVYGNAGGDYVGSIAGQYGINGNICEDPLFCDPENGDFSLHEDSPCAPFTPPNEECDLIGAWPVGCGPTATRVGSWGAIKAVFRK